MNRLKSLLCCIILQIACYAQNYTVNTYIGDDDDYWSGAYVYNFIDVGDNLSEWVDLPFEWSFYGQSVAGYKIAHDGYITFNNISSVSDGINTSLPSVIGPNNAIYALWDDFDSGAVVSTKTFGIKPHRIHEISWASMGVGWSGPTVNINIYEGCADFEVVLNDGVTDSSTIGCENSDGTLGIQIEGSPNYVPDNPGYSSNSYEVHRFTWNDVIENDASLIGIDVDNHLDLGDHFIEGFIRNEGTNIIESYDINYTLNDGEIQTENIVSSTEVLIGDYEVIIETVEWSEEISWEIISTDGEVVAQGNEYSDGNTYNIPLCAPIGDLTFTWYDSYGDGWNGCSYTVLDSDGNILVANSPLDGSSGFSTFTSLGSSCDSYITSLLKNSKKHYWEHSIPIVIEDPSDNYELKVWVSNVNGELDEMSCNDTLIEYVTGIKGITADRKVLVEEWTGTWCAYCIDGAVVIDELEEAFDDNVIPIAIHDGDPMEFQDSLRIGFSASAYPMAIINRKSFSETYDYTNEAVDRSSWISIVGEEINSYSPVEVVINHDWNSETRTITADVTANYVDHSAGDARLILMIIEDSLSNTGSDWAQANGYDDTPGHPYYGAGNSVNEFQHRHVLRDYVESSCFGVDGIIPHLVAIGSSYSYTFSYELPSDFNENQISLVAAVVKYSATNDAGYIGMRGARDIYNSNEAKLTTEEVSLAEVNSTFSFYPNPVNRRLIMSSKVQYELYNSIGEFISNGYSDYIEMNNYSSGLYFLSVENKMYRIIKQ